MHTIALRYAALAATACLLIFGFQNCADDPIVPPKTPDAPSVLKPVVSQMCENTSDQSNCLLRAKCTVSTSRNCQDASHFTGTDNTLGLSLVAPVLVRPDAQVSLWASISKDSVNYQWYKNTGFYNLADDAGTAQADATKKYFQLPECNTADAEADSAKLNHNSVTYYYAQATYGEPAKTLKAPFLVACVQDMATASGHAFKGLSADDAFSHDGIRRKVCSKNSAAASCGANDYKALNADKKDLVLIRNQKAVELQAKVDEASGVSYKWYMTTSPNEDLAAIAETASCSADANTACVVQKTDASGPEDAPSLALKFDSANTGNNACGANEVVYFHALATKSDDENYKKQATFRVACVEGVASAPAFAENASVAAQTLTQNQAMADLTLPAVASGGKVPLVYSLQGPAATDSDMDLPAGLSFNAETRVLSGTPTAVQSVKAYTYKVTDANGAFASLSFNITVNVAAGGGDAACDPAHQCCEDGQPKTCPEGTTLNSGTCGCDQASTGGPSFSSGTRIVNSWRRGQVNISVMLPQASGGRAPLQYNLIPYGGSPQPSLQSLGLSLSNRRLSGNISVSAPIGEHRYEVTVEDANGQTITYGGLYKITITAAPTSVQAAAPSFSEPTVISKNYQQGAQMQSLTLPLVNNGSQPIAYSLAPTTGAGQTGVELSALGLRQASIDDRIIVSARTSNRVGAAAPVGTHNYTYTATDADGRTATRTLRITITQRTGTGDTIQPSCPAGKVQRSSCNTNTHTFTHMPSNTNCGTCTARTTTGGDTTTPPPAPPATAAWSALPAAQKPTGFTPSSCWDRFNWRSIYNRATSVMCKTDTRPGSRTYRQKINFCSGICSVKTDALNGRTPSLTGVLMRVDPQGATQQKQNITYQWQKAECSYDVSSSAQACTPTVFRDIGTDGRLNFYKAKCRAGETKNYKYRLKVSKTINGTIYNKVLASTFNLNCYSCNSCPSAGQGAHPGLEMDAGGFNGQCSNLCTGQ